MYILVGSRFWDWAHYNESVESGSGSWALIRWWLVLWGEKTYRIGRPRGLREKVPLARGLGSPIPLASLPSLCEISIVIYPTPPFIFSLHLSVIHVYIWVHVPSTTFSSALWAAVAPITLSRGHIYLYRVYEVNCGHLIWRWQLFLGLLFYHAPMASP